MEFTSRSNKSKTGCCVYGCRSVAKESPTIKFHGFPKAYKHKVKIKNKSGEYQVVDRLFAWKKVLKIRKVTTGMKVCSLHFKPSDFFVLKPNQSKRCLKSTSVPSCNLPQDPIEGTSSRAENCQSPLDDEKNNIKMEESEEIELGDIDIIEHNIEGDYIVKSESVDSFAEQCVDSTVDSFTEQCVNNYVEIDENHTEILVDSDYLTPSILDIIKSDSDLLTLTGIPTFNILNDLENIVQKVEPSNNANLDLKNYILMTFMKLKLNLPYSALAVMFKFYTEEEIRGSIDEMINLLHIGMEPFVEWQSKEEILNNMPPCFDGFESVRVVLECIKTSIEKPKNLCCQPGNYAQCNSTSTIKVMAGLSPEGLITFVSKAYGGCATDTAIFTQSDIAEKLEETDAIMVDRLFSGNISKVCEDSGIILFKPFHSREGKKTPADKLMTPKKMTAARVHVDRTIKRLKNFQIIKQKIPSELVSRSAEIFFIVSAIVNLGAPPTGDNFSED